VEIKPVDMLLQIAFVLAATGPVAVPIKQFMSCSMCFSAKGGHRGKNAVVGNDRIPMLSELGITKDQSSRRQKLTALAKGRHL
jgi:hypothetical protein